MHRREWLLVAIVLSVMSVLLMRGIGNPYLGYPDADRILMDGVFVFDFLKDLPITRIYDYTVAYYGQYPALSIGYRPSFIPLVEAAFNGVFGVNTWSSRLAILAFAMVGVTAWYRLIGRIFDYPTAFWASLLLVTTPFLVQWGWYTMAEIPVLSMAVLTGYLFYRYVETERPGYIYATAIVYSLAVWTKQTMMYLAIWLLLYMLVTGTLVPHLKRREFWIASAIGAVMLAPLAMITLWLGGKNIDQSIGRLTFLSRFHWDNLKIYIDFIYVNQITLPLLALSLVGMGCALFKFDRRTLYFVLLFIVTYLFFTYIVAKSPRYSILLIPVFAMFAASPVHYLRGRPMVRLAFTMLLAGVSVYQVSATYARIPYYATGYDEAASYVLENSASPTVFFDGYNNGYFTYFMRAFDSDRSMYVLRGDKLLSSSSVYYNRSLEVHAHSRKDIIDIFDRYGVTYIVVESIDQSGVDIHRELRRLLQEDRFVLEQSIPVQSNRTMLRDQTLLIYRYLDAKSPSADHLELRLPIVDRNIRVPLRDLDALRGPLPGDEGSPSDDNSRSTSSGEDPPVTGQ